LSGSTILPTSAIAVVSNSGINAYNSLASVNDGPGTVRCVARIFGTLRNGATAGTVNIRARSENAANGLTVKRGSWGSVWQLN
jgi:hypothetical protein